MADGARFTRNPEILAPTHFYSRSTTDVYREIHDRTIEHLLDAMDEDGVYLGTHRRPTVIQSIRRLEEGLAMNRNEHRSWLLHAEIHRLRSNDELVALLPRFIEQAEAIRQRVQGEPHLTNVTRWVTLLEGGNIAALRLVLVGTDRQSIEMREVSPLLGSLSEMERRNALQQA